MLLDSLRPTQCGLRYVDQIASMVEFVRSGGVFSQEALLRFAEANNHEPDNLIQVRRFEDGTHFIHDGHHRCLSIWLAGRENLDAQEFDLSIWHYHQYGEINFDAGYVTPHDPREETRYADFFGFKSEARKIAETSVEEAIEFIRGNRSRYCEPRTCWHVRDLAATLPLRG